MLQILTHPSGNVQLPYTTADMAERLAKKKAAKDRQDILDSFQGGLSYGKGGVDITPQLSQVGGMVKNLALTASGTVADMVPYVANIPGVKGSGAWGYEPENDGTSNFFQAGAQGLEQAGRRAVGDITAIPYVGKPSASPTATDIKRLGVIEGLSKAGLDYGNLALTAAPFVGPAAKGIEGILGAQVAAEIPYIYGVHVSPIADLAEIQTRKMLQQQFMAGDAFPGSSYMWDARSPNVFFETFENSQLNKHMPSGQQFNFLELSEDERVAIPKPNVYLTRAPANQVFQDANVPGSSSLRVAGNQEILERLPSDRAALQAAFDKYGITQRSAQADRLEIKYRGMNPQVRMDLRVKPFLKAEEDLRATIRNQTRYYTANFPDMMKLDFKAPLVELLKDPAARNFYIKKSGVDPAKLDDILANGLPR